MAVTWKDDQGHTLSNAYTTVVTFSANAISGGAKVQGITLVNTNTTTDRLVTIQLIPSGQSAATQYIIFSDTVPHNSAGGLTMPVPGGPWPASASAFVQAKQDAGTDIVIRVHAFEES